MGPRPSTTVPTNDIIVDMTTSTTSKPTEILQMNQRLTTNEKDLTEKYNFMSLLEPD